MVGAFFRQFGKYLLSGKEKAAIAALLFALLPFFGLPLGWLATLIIGLVTLQQGWKMGFWTLAWAILPPVAFAASGDPGILLYVGINDVLMWCFAAVLRKTRSWALVLEIGTLLGVLVIGIAHGLVNDIVHWWDVQLLRYVQDVAGFPKEKVAQVAQFATGIEAVVALLMSVSNLLVARWWQDLMPGLSRNASVREELYRISISRFLLGFFLLASVAVVVQIPVAVDALPVLLLPFVLAGISLFHWFMKDRKNNAFVMVFFYFSLVFSSLYMLGLLAFIGLTDSWFGFRKRINSYKKKRGY